MPRLTDPEILACYRNALANWKFDGYVLLVEDAQKGLRTTLPGWTGKGFRELLYNFVHTNGGEIDQVEEVRPNWKNLWSHHYDMRPVIDGITIYVETRLKYDDPADPDDPVIYIVNIHLA